MRLMERRGWTLLALPIMVLVFLLAQIDTTTHLSPSKPTEIQRTKATWKEKNENRKLAKQYAWVAFGWRGGEWECLESLWTNESRFDHFASNQQGSSAFGIAQLLGERSRNPALQILRGLRYIDTLVMEHLAKLTSSLLPTDTTKE
jgi:hypothetical protein